MHKNAFNPVSGKITEIKYMLYPYVITDFPVDTAVVLVDNLNNSGTDGSVPEYSYIYHMVAPPLLTLLNLFTLTATGYPLQIRVYKRVQISVENCVCLSHFLIGPCILYHCIGLEYI